MRPYYRDDLLQYSRDRRWGPRWAAALDAVALWWWVDGDGDAVFDSPAVSSVPGSAGDRLARAMAAMADLAPAGPHWYLDVLASPGPRSGAAAGGHPPAPRAGPGRRSGRHRVSGDQRPGQCVGLYEHFGFEVTGEMTLEGLWLCGMTRPPRPTGVA